MRWTLNPELRLGIAVLAVFLMALPALALEKAGMPDLCQDEETCVPTSAANVIVYFAKNGYPKLLQSGATESEREVHTMHAVMAATGARYELGTRVDLIAVGLQKYIREAGYTADVEYRGVDLSQIKIPAAARAMLGWKDNVAGTAPKSFSADWLQQNDDPNKAFILLLGYCHVDPANNVYTNAGPGHAVTLVNVMPDMLLVHDPSHYASAAGRKILTPVPLSSGVLRMPGFDAPLDGHMIVSGSNLLSPPDTVVVVTGAVCVTMHPLNQPVAPATDVSNTELVGSKSGAGSGSTTPAKTAPSSGNQGWATWAFRLLFGN